MNIIKIRQPLWSDRSIGIAKYKIIDDIYVEIEYRDKDGFRIYPHIYFMKKAKALSYSSHKIGNKNIPELVQIPIDDFEVKQMRLI